MIGLGVQTWGTDVAALQRYWAAADELGYARVTYGDGLWSLTHDGWTLLAALATVTRRCRIGHAVTYAFDPAAHHPSWIAKRSVALDHLSGGRFDLRLGIGANGPDAEAIWRSHGIAYPPPDERIARVDESVAIVRSLWRGAAVTHAGRMGTWSGARVEPAPVQRPGPPVWIAAMGPRALDLVARRADGWEASYVTPERFARLWNTVEENLARESRAPATLARSVELDVSCVDGDAERALDDFCAARAVERGDPLATTVLAGDPDVVAARIAEYAAAGATDLMLGFADFPSTRLLEAFAGSVRPRLEALTRAGVSRP